MAGSDVRPITIAMSALGGQGGGVITKWLVDIAESNGYLAQSTYVAGVAQRTGATIYCVEIYPRASADAHGREPVFAQYPVPGDVDLVIASEMAETGRALEKGFVTPNITTLIASSHRVYSITEKSALGDGISDQTQVVEAAKAAAKNFISFDMEAVAVANNSVVSAVILGAIAGSGVLPFTREAFETGIRESGRSVETNLAGFAAGYVGARQGVDGTATLVETDPDLPQAQAQGPQGTALLERIATEFPVACRNVTAHGALRALSYQDLAYAEFYLEQVLGVLEVDKEAGGESQAFRLTQSVARQLALQMCYEDTIRVAEIKTRSQRIADIGKDIGAKSDQPFYVTEYFHPRYEEFCDTLPAGLAARLLSSATAKNLTRPFFRSGRLIRTNKIGGFVMMHLLSKLRRWRRGTHRYKVQQEHIGVWLEALKPIAKSDYESSVAVAESVQIVRGYGDTYERGLSRYRATLEVANRIGGTDRAEKIRGLQTAALADEQGKAFEKALAELAAEPA